MKFPDTERALVEILDELVYVVIHTEKNPPVPRARLTVIPSPGGSEPFLKQERIQISVYSDTRTGAKTIANDIVSKLDGKYHVTSFGLLDLTEVISHPAEVAMDDGTLTQFALSINIHTRPLKEVKV